MGAVLQIKDDKFEDFRWKEGRWDLDLFKNKETNQMDWKAWDSVRSCLVSDHQERHSESRSVKLRLTTQSHTFSIVPRTVATAALYWGGETGWPSNDRSSRLTPEKQAQQD